MIIYRPQRGGLFEAMKEARIFEDETEMKNFIVQRHNGMFGFDDIEIDDMVTNDERIGWRDTRYVCTRRYGDEDFIKLCGTSQAIGYCAADFSWNGGTLWTPNTK